MYDKEPDCDECIPPLFAQNEDVVKIFFLVQSQIIINAMSGKVLGLNHLAIWEAIDRYKVKDQIGVFENVLNLFSYFHNLENEDEEEGG